MIDVILALMIILAFLIAIALHEFSHALVASWLGDASPRQEGRQTLTFSSHIDPLGLLMCIVLAFQIVIAGPLGIAAGPLGLGWGKPVKPDPWKMHVKNPDLGVFLVAIAGPLFSLAIGLLTTVIIGFIGNPLATNVLTQRILQFLIVFASVNIALAILNILPLYPLDGYQILYTMLPSKQALSFSRSAQYGPFIILGIFFLLPFIGSLTHASSFPLFHLSFYILQGSLGLIALLLSPFAPIYDPLRIYIL
jgi:Zn-dependent protease